MYYFTIGSGNSFHNCFRHCWMRVNSLDDLFPGCFQFPGSNRLSYHLCDIIAYHMTSKPFAILGIKDYLNKTIL